MSKLFDWTCLEEDCENGESSSGLSTGQPQTTCPASAVPGLPPANVPQKSFFEIKRKSLFDQYINHFLNCT